MRTIITLAKKDLALLLRDKLGLFFAFVFPLLMAMFFGAVFSGGGDEGTIEIALHDGDDSVESRQLVARLVESGKLDVTRVDDVDAARGRVRTRKAVAFLSIPEGFGAARGRMLAGGRASVLLGMDPSRRAEGGMVTGMITEAVWTDAMSGFGGGGSGGGEKFELPFDVEVERVERKFAGPNNSYAYSFPQGILWGVFGCAAAFSIGLVVERTRGTFLRLRIAPITRIQILAGKGAACFVTTLAVQLVMFILAIAAFDVRPSSFALLLMTCVSSAICVVGIMMLLAVLGKTEAAAGGIGWAVIIVIQMFGGGMLPLFVMPGFMRTLSHFSPARYMTEAYEGAIWRDWSFVEVATPCGVLLAIGVVCFALGAKFFPER